jgi:DNA-binding response OmpR family regulator
MKAVKVLVVEDNPLVLNLIVKGMEPHCEILQAADGADALLKTIDDPPDMIISDYKMPGLDGRQLYEKLRSRDRTKAIPFIFLASRGDIEEKLRPLVEGVEDFIIKPFFLKDFVRRVKKVVDRLQLEKMQKRSTRPGVIQGRLEEMSIMDLLQSLEMGQKSCKLTLTRDNDKCEMFFIGGACRHAILGNVEGEEAVYKAAAWNAGEFEIDFNGSSEKSTITRSTQGLLMEAFRLMDEANRDAADVAG